MPALKCSSPAVYPFLIGIPVSLTAMSISVGPIKHSDLKQLMDD